jgi:hypothetical protein
MSEKLVKLSLEDFSKFAKDDDPSLAIADTCFLSTRPNSHGLVISEEVLREYAPTILGKFLVGNMNWARTDTMGHESRPDIFGYFPTDQEIRFVEKDGYLLAYAYVVISKIYATEYYEIFKRDNFRNTSVEMLCEFSDEERQIVSAFRIEGLSSLGASVKQSCPDAHIEVIRFSEKEATEYYNRSRSIWDEDVKGEVLMSKPKEKEDIVMEEQKDEKLETAEAEAMAEEKTEEPTSEEPKEDEKMAEPTEEEPKDEPKEEDGEVKASEEEVKAGCGEDEKLGCGEEKLEEEDSEDDKEPEDDDKEDDHDEEKMAELEAKLAEKDETIAKMQEQIDALVQFKEEKENLEKMSVVNATLAQVKDKMSQEDYAKFEEKGNACKLEDVTAWKNEVLANVATILMSEKAEEDGITRMSIEIEETKPKGLWD